MSIIWYKINNEVSRSKYHFKTVAENLLVQHSRKIFSIVLYYFLDNGFYIIIIYLKMIQEDNTYNINKLFLVKSTHKFSYMVFNYTLGTHER